MSASSLPPPPPSAPALTPTAPAAPEPAKRKGALVVAFSVLIAVVATTVAVGAWLAAPGRCEDADFTSSRYAYCVATPEGTVPSEVDDESGQYDRFELEGSGALVQVTATRLPQGQGLQEFVEGFVAAAQEQSFAAQPAVPVRVAGAAGVQVDFTGETGGTPVHFRFVFVERERVVWQVDLRAVEEQFAEHTDDLNHILDSWTFT